MDEDEQTTKPRQVRVAKGAWTAYEAVCERLGRTRAEDINDHIRRMIRRHGTAEEKALLAEADAEVQERRTRKYSGLKSRQHKPT